MNMFTGVGGCLYQLKARLIHWEPYDAHKLNAAWTHRPVGVDAIDPAHALYEPKAAASTLSIRYELARFYRRQRGEQRHICLMYFESFFQYLQCEVCGNRRTNEKGDVRRLPSKVNSSSAWKKEGPASDADLIGGMSKF